MKWSEKDIEYLKKVYPFNSNKKIANYFGRSCTSVQQKAIKLNLKKDDEYINTGCFKKGHIPWNKNLKGINIGGKETQYKKGHLPHNTKYDGCITLRKDKTGRYYKMIRISLGNWEYLHRHVWQNHYGKIPDGYIIIFKDGNSLNCNIENLMMISRKTNLKRNRDIKKFIETIKKTWERERIRGIYNLPFRTKLMQRCKYYSHDTR